jgi:hypothetical protein
MADRPQIPNFDSPSHTFMKKYIIERMLPGAGRLSAAELKHIAQKSCEVIDQLEAPYHWIETYVTDNKLYCIHIAPDRETVLEHARQGGFPTDSIAEVRYVMDPTTSAIKLS